MVEDLVWQAELLFAHNITISFSKVSNKFTQMM